jgi:uncharacterized protein YggE
VIARLLFAPGFALPLAAVLLLSSSPASAQTAPVQPQTTNGVSVVGEGIVLAQPDAARITLGADVSDPSLATAQAQAAQRMDAVVAKLKADGIDEKDIRTVSYNITPQYDQQANQGQPVLRGYNVQNLVEVRTTDVPGLGSLLDDAVGSGATRIFGVTFEASDMESLKNQARDQAMANAQAKAQQLAKSAGVTLGKPISIEESDTGGVTPVQSIAPASPPPPRPPRLFSQGNSKSPPTFVSRTRSSDTSPQSFLGPSRFPFGVVPPPVAATRRVNLRPKREVVARASPARVVR